jgi:hypothetical protein
MGRHVARMAVALLVFMACLLYPFLPGSYDGMAVTLSAMAQLVGMAGILLVPLGVLWLAHEFRMRAVNTGTVPPNRVSYWFGWTSLCAATLVAIVASVGAVIDSHQSAGVAALALWAYCASGLAAGLRARRNTERATLNVAPLYLVVLPTLAAVLTFTVIVPASEFSRNRAIDASARLIADIERYRDAHGHYPVSLQSLWDDYRPPVIGIERYHYEPNGNSYNLYFEHFAVALDQKEIVMYNPNGDQDFSSHNTDLLVLSPTEVAAQRGHTAVHDASRFRWKYFLFD